MKLKKEKDMVMFNLNKKNQLKNVLLLENQQMMLIPKLLKSMIKTSLSADSSERKKEMIQEKIFILRIYQTTFPWKN
jgi:hypothetical protein